MITKFNVRKTRNLDRINRILGIFLRKPAASCGTDIKAIKNILIVDFALIGDMVMDIPFLKAIRKNCPDAHITMVAMPWAKDILGDQGLIDRFVIFNGKDCLSTPLDWLIRSGHIRSTLRKLNERSYDIAFEPKGDMRHSLFMRLTTSRRTVSYDYTGGSYLVTDSFHPRIKTEHLIDEKLDILEMAGFDIKGCERVPVLMLSDKRKRFAEDYRRRIGLRTNVIGLHSGAGTENKLYRHFPEIVGFITGLQGIKEGFDFLVFDDEETTETDEICEALDRAGARYFRVGRELDEFISVLSLCSHLICNDSAPGHIAAALGIQVMVIFGPINRETALPRGDKKVIGISIPMDCKPCTLPECPRRDNACMEQIPWQMITDGILALLDRNE